MPANSDLCINPLKSIIMIIPEKPFLQRFLCLIVSFLLFFTHFLYAQPAKEFRAVWIATVGNTDWPSQKGLSAEDQKNEFIRLLDFHKQNGINAIIMQIRPAADAIYPSPYEPWSEWLTGVQGMPPSPWYDPLAFMIDETHKRGMEFHAWCNPYRAHFNIAKSSIAASHITRRKPEWFVTYGDKRYFDPGNKEAREYVVQVVRDVVSRYKVDGIHFDDYFYPYPIAGKEFPDTKTYQQYGNGMSKVAWRRSNVDSIIERLYQTIRSVKPAIKFGISPYGIWRNNDKDPRGSFTKTGLSNYDDLYADILLWLKKGWIDYVTPQLYWELEHPTASFETLIDWWSQNTYGKHCYIGIGLYRAGSNKAWQDSTQLLRQIDCIRQTYNVQGMVFFSSKSFEKNPHGLNDILRQHYFREPARIPEMEWLKR